MLYLLIALCFVSAKVDMNEIVDTVLDAAKGFAMEYHLDTVRLPDFKQKFTNKKIGPWVITGSFDASEGTVKNTTNINRVGDVVVTTPGDNDLHVSIDISFDKLEAVYKKFIFDMPLASSDGGMKVTVGKNEVKVVFTFIFDSSGFCNVTINQAELVDLSDISVVLLPDGFFNGIKDTVVNVYLNHHISGLEQAVNQYLQTILQVAINLVNPCGYIPVIKDDDKYMFLY